MQFMYPILISIGVLATGFLFKIMHWPLAGILFSTGLLGAGIFSVLSISKKPDKKPLDYLRILTLLGFMVRALFFIMHWPHAGLVNLIFLVLAITWATCEIWRVTGSYQRGERSVSRLIYTVSGLSIMMGGLFKLLHWLGGSWMLVGGLVSLSIWFAVDSLLLTNHNHSQK